MKKLGVTEARNRLGRIIRRAERRDDRVILHRRGHPIAAVISMRDLELLERAEDEIDVREAKKRLREKGTIPWEKIKKDLGL